MDIKINQIQQTVPPETTEQIQQTDDKFKFILTSKLEDAGLAYIQTRFYRYLPFPRTGRCRRRHCLSEERKKIKPSH